MVGLQVRKASLYCILYNDEGRWQRDTKKVSEKVIENPLKR